MKKIVKLINKKRILLLLTIILGLGISLGAVYFMYYKKDDRLNNLSTGLISLDYKELSNVALTSNVPVIDEVGLRSTPYSFKATNTSAVPLALTIKLDVLKKEKMIPLGAVRYGVFINNKKVKKDYIHDDKILYTYENMAVGETIEVNLYFWIDYYYDIPDQNFEATIQVEANNTSSFGEITPLTVSYNSTNVENNKQYIMTSIKNYATIEEKDMNLLTPENMKLEVSGDNIRFTYKDSLGNSETTEQDNLVINYTMNQKLDTNVQIFLSPTTNSNITTDVKIKLTKDGKEYEQVQTVNLVGGQYCKTNGFTKLSDCLLVSENFSNNVETAKTYIENKGQPDLNKTSPEYTYLQDFTENYTYTGSSGYKWYFADKYFFDSATGKFTLKKSDGTTNETTQVDLTNGAIGKYTCGTTNISSSNNCQTIYKVSSVNISTRQITGQMITNKVASTLQGETGLYKTTDNQGKTYFYRGDVKNNNVLFGGYYWKIVRINGDGSIRLIFNGNSTGMNKNNASISNSNANGYGATYPYNPVHGGPTYVGYMYNEEDDVWESGAANHTDFNVTYSYYWGNQNDFEELEDEYGTYFKLKSTYNRDPKTLVEMSNDATQLAATPYTCKGTNITDTCRVLYKVNSITIENNNSVTTSTNYYTKSPDNPDLSIVHANNKDSNVKKQLELWYENKLMNKINNGNQVSDYIVDNIWCNDRSITGTGTNYSGYKLTERTYFAGYNRFTSQNKTATLRCQNDNDKFSKTAGYGNAKLKYPVGLITADEVTFAGGKYNEKNSDYYLRTDGYFYTMTPSYFSASYASATVWSVHPTGTLNVSYVYDSRGLRAVINLSSNTLISDGDGSLNNPYQLKLS